jgi:leader peptidase (prepilin peptidase)/N-methyltransferase
MMPLWQLCGIGALGLVLGSFLNVVIARVPEGRSIVAPPSHCPQCSAPIRWYDNIPLLSYAWLKGRCRSCRAGISPRYPLVEFLTGLLFVAGAVKYGWTWVTVVRDWPMILILVSVTFIDLDHRIIPDSLSLGGVALGLATAYWDWRVGLAGALEGAALGFGVFYAMAWIYQRTTGRSGLGGGDIKLLAMLGAFLGPSGVFCTILVSSVLGSLIGIAWAILAKRKEGEGVMKVAIPYGPFLVVGGLYYYLLGDWLWLQFTIPT